MSVSGYMTKARLKDGQLRYSLSSLLAGPQRELACSPTKVEAKGVSLLDCVGIAEEEGALIAAQFRAASAGYRGYSDGIGMARVQLVLVPMGVGYRERAEFIATPDQLPLKLSLRYSPGSEPLRRAAVRTYAHELVHLDRVASRWQVSRQREEYLASLMESCVELEVFGDSKGYAREGEIAVLGMQGLSRAQKRSADMFSAALTDVRAFTQREQPLRRGQGRFEGFCRQTFAAMERGDPS